MRRFALTIFAAVLCMATAFAQEVTEQTRQVSGFNAVASGGPFRVHITMGNTESLKLVVDADLIDKVETVVEDGTLKIQIKRSEQHYWNDRHFNKAEVYITAKSLNALVNSGSGNMTVDGLIKTDNFKVVMSGSGSISTSVKADEAHITLSGSGSIKLDGRAASINAMVSGSGQIEGKDFSTETASVVISGSGNVYVKADKELKANLIGSGGVYYSGNAQVESHKMGSGRVSKMD